MRTDTPKTDADYKGYQGLIRASIATGDLLIVSRNLEQQNRRLVDALQNLRGWAVANARTPIHDLLKYTDAALET